MQNMCQAGVNAKVIQDTLEYSYVSKTLSIYANVAKDLKKSDFKGDEWFGKSMNQTDIENDPSEK